MRIVIFGGTTEGRELSARLSEDGAEVTVCVASDYGGEEQARVPGVEACIGPLSPDEKQRLLEGAALCVDATHPYATHITASVREACHQAKVDYLRLLRGPCAGEQNGNKKDLHFPETENPTADRGFPGGSADGSRIPEQGVITVNSAEEAAAWLSERQGNILLTTGAKELAAFSGLPPERLFPRVLPSHAGIDACEALRIPHRNILALQGPFTRELNTAIIRQYQIRYVVTKDSGVPGGFPEKAEAAKETGVQLIVLRRPEEDGLPFDEVLKRCRARLQCESAAYARYSETDGSR